jgi:hypothetical protein
MKNVISYKYVEKHVLNELKSAEDVKTEFIKGKEAFTKSVRALIDDAEMLILEGEEDYDNAIKQSDIAIGYYRGLLDMMAKRSETPAQLALRCPRGWLLYPVDSSTLNLILRICSILLLLKMS